MNIAEAMDVAEESQNREAGNQLASFSPEEFLDNIISAATYYCAKGFDAFDEVVLTSLSLDKETAHQVVQGSLQTYAKVLAQMQQQMALFQNQALASTMTAPRPSISELPRTEQAEVDEQQEDECDQRLASLAGKILQVRVATRKAQTEAAMLRQEIAVHGDHKGLAEITLPIVAGKENLASVAEAILNQAKQLGPLLDQAEKVMLRHQATKAGMSSQSATLLAEKEFSARKAASNGLLAEDLKMLRERLVLQ